jgi:alcohol dehydrogenase class IV
VTYAKQLSHGQATGLFIPVWMNFNLKKSSSPKVLNALKLGGFRDIDELQDLISRICGAPPVCNLEEKGTIVEKALQSKNMYNNVAIPQIEDVVLMVESCFHRGEEISA